MPDGEYRLGSHRVTKCMGGVRLADGTLAGSTLTMDQALRNLIGLGLSLREASLRVSTHAADYLGVQDRGGSTKASMPTSSCSTVTWHCSACSSKGKTLTSRMLDEAREAPAAVARLLAADRDGYASLGAELQAAPRSRC